MTKAEKIKQTLKETKERRKSLYVKKEHFERDQVRTVIGIDFGVANICGNTINRDLNSAINILEKGLNLSHNQVVGLDQPELTPAEMSLATKILGSNPYIKVAVIDEAGSSHLKKVKEDIILI